ncbi:MAG: hypothetical protein CSA76_05480 [Spirochaetales bacterium]|nr:MAG: hypothetical protein CSA76_05480 [Spirochaetales bacterium]
MMGTKGRKPVTKKKKPFWLLWLLLLLLLLIGGFIGWDLSGKAPWGSVFGRSDTSGYEENAGSSETAENDLSEAGTSSEASTATSAETSTSTSAETETVSQQQEEAVKPVDADVAPRTKDEVESYLNVNGRVSITEADIHLAANEIAVQNGYKDLDYRVYTGNDPDWIYPGGELLLPGSGSYTVRKGDTIWFLAARQVRKGVEAELVEYDKAVSILKNSTAAGAEKQEAKAALKKIFNESRAKAMRLMAAEALNSAEN